MAPTSDRSSTVRDQATRGAADAGAVVVGAPGTGRGRGGRHAYDVGAGSDNGIDVIDAEVPTPVTALVAIWAPTGDVALHTSRDALGDHVGNEISPWLAPAIGTTDRPLGCVTTSRP